jgi:hypothetical protein
VASKLSRSLIGVEVEVEVEVEGCPIEKAAMSP